jgi:choline dehydrogenase-like flavoprotein
VALFRDLRESKPDQAIETDICIIGAGAAGCTIAHGLARTRSRVCLLEAGGADPSAAPPVEIIGRPYRTSGESRGAGLGGTTHLWGGHCVPYRDMHLRRREWVPGAEWPFGRDTLRPWYERAHDLLEIGPFDYDALSMAQTVGLQPMPLESDFETTLSRYRAVAFDADFLSALPNLTVLLNGRAARLNPGDGGRVESLSVHGRAPHDTMIRARIFVLATGGIENARLLLASGESTGGLANSSGLVGRNFMEHIAYFSGALVPARTSDVHGKFAAYSREVPHEGYTVRFHVAATEGFERRMGIPAFRAELHATPLTRWAGKRLNRTAGDGIRSWTEAARVIARHPLSTARTLAGQSAPPWCFWLMNYAEQVPNPDSRVTLSTRRDEFGDPMAALDWRLSPADRRGILEAQKALASTVERTGLGRLWMELPEKEEDDAHVLPGANGGAHHMGTTRMSDDPRTGVVDADMRCHDVSNLYVAGSSVFPGGGWANPTLTIIALSLRLADHLETLTAAAPERACS